MGAGMRVWGVIGGLVVVLLVVLLNRLSEK